MRMARSCQGDITIHRIGAAGNRLIEKIDAAGNKLNGREEKIAQVLDLFTKARHAVHTSIVSASALKQHYKVVRVFEARAASHSQKGKRHLPKRAKQNETMTLTAAPKRKCREAAKEDKTPKRRKTELSDL